ncbi:MAG: hypothetical protein R6W73_03060 [Candidatus Saliniplasma sp.]
MKDVVSIEGDNKIPEDCVDRCGELYKDGWSMEKIAKEFDVGVGTVSRRFRIKGVQIKDHRGVPDETVDEWGELYENGVLQAEIAKIYGVTQATVSYRLNKRS